MMVVEVVQQGWIVIVLEQLVQVLKEVENVSVGRSHVQGVVTVSLVDIGFLAQAMQFALTQCDSMHSYVLC